MPITPLDIQQRQFKLRFRGYDPATVDHFLEMLGQEIERLTRQGQELREELARTRANLKGMQAREATLKETLMTTQRISEEIKGNARKEAELILNQARMRGEKIVREAEDRRLQLVSEIQELKRQQISFETSMRALVESHLRLLDIEVLPMEAGGRRGNLLAQSSGEGSEGGR